MSLALLTFSFGLASGTVQASSATDQYIEPEVPSVPGKQKEGHPGEKHGTVVGTPDRASRTGAMSGEGALAGGQDRDRYSSESGLRDDDKGSGSYGNRTATTGDIEGAGEAAAAAVAFHGSGGGGSGGGGGALLLVALLAGIPLLAGIGYAIYHHRQRGSDTHAQDRLREMFSPGDTVPSGKP